MKAQRKVELTLTFLTSQDAEVVLALMNVCIGELRKSVAYAELMIENVAGPEMIMREPPPG